MKSSIVVLLVLALSAVPAIAGNDEPQKYQVDFTLRYNAVDAETIGKILVYLEQLRKQAGSVKLEPCKWDVNIKKAEEELTWVTGGDYIITFPDQYVRNN